MKPTQTTTQETSLFSTEIYSSGIGDIERSQYDPFWDEIILDSEITVIEPTGQTTLFYDSTIEPPLPEEFNSIEAYNAAHDSWCVNHPELVNHGFKKDSERVIGEDRKFTVGDKLFSNHAFGEMIVEVVEYPSVANDYINYDSVVTKNSNINCLYLSKDLKAPNKSNYCSESLYHKALEKYEKFCNQCGDDSNLQSKKQDKPEFKEGCVYRHSSGKKAKITKLFKTTGKCCVYLEGEIIQEKISLSELSSLNTEELVREKENQLTKGDRVFSKQLQRNGEVVHVGKSGITIDWINWIKLAYSFSQIEELKLSRIDYPCLPCSTVTQEQVQPQLLVTNSELEQFNLLKLTLQHSEFSNTDFQTSQSTQTSEIIKGNLSSTTFTGSASHAQEQVTLETEKDLTIQSLECGSIPCERSPLNSLNLLLLNNPEELLTTDLEQFLEDLEWLSTVGKIQKSYQQRNSVLPTKEKGCSLLPTPTTYPKGSTGCRPAGTNRLEQKLRPFIAKGDKLHPAAPGWMMGFPVGWVEQVLADTGDLLLIQPPFILEQDTISTTAATVSISTVEPLPHNKQKLLSEELNILQNLQELETTTNTDNQTTTYNKPWYKGKFNLGDLVVWQKYPDLIYEIVKPEKGGHVVIELKSHSDSAFLRKRVAVIYLTPTNTDNQTTTTKIKALTLHQPWASLVGKYKHFETRGKATNYRGKIAIHAAIRQETTDYQINELSDLLVGENLPFSCVVAIADLSDCIKITQEFISQQSETELRCGFWEVGRYAWKLENVVILDEPIPARGMPGLWDFELPITNYPLPVTKPEFKPGEYILNGRVGQIIEASLGEYFVVKYGDGYADLKCYFWGQDDELINSLAIAPQELVEKFLGENISEVSLEKNNLDVDEIVSQKFLGENISEVSLEKNNLDVDEIASQKFLGENISEVSLEKKKKVASGSLAPYLEHKKVKDGTIVTYPRVVGDRDKNNPSHWKWGYYYEIKIDGEWKNRSISTPFSIVSQVKIMIECDRSVEEIKTFIMNNKIKKQKS
jgi:hypothetical protein